MDALPQISSSNLLGIKFVAAAGELLPAAASAYNNRLNDIALSSKSIFKLTKVDIKKEYLSVGKLLIGIAN